jgi:hypothetical protein
VSNENVSAETGQYQTRLADALLDPAYERDGVSLLGGEPVRRIVGA